MRLKLLALVVIGMFYSACSEAEEPALAPPDSARRAQVDSISGPLSVIIREGEDVRELRLAMLETPDPDYTRDRLIAHLGSGPIFFEPVREAPDRYGRLIARVWTEPEGGIAMLQASLIEDGAARLLPYPDNTETEIRALLALEAEARTRGQGLWGVPDYAIRDTDPDMLAQLQGELHLIQGRIMRVAELDSGRVYLNFGSDWRSDFTIRIDEEDREAFDAAAIAFDSLEGREVRVRGIIRRENGPIIRLAYPMRLELLEE